MDVKEIMAFLFGDAAKDVDSIDKFKERFSGETAMFVPVSELNDSKSETFKRFMPKAVGQVAGKTMTALKKRLGELDIQLTPEEIKDKGVEDVVDIALSKAVSHVKGKFTEYDDKLKQNTDDRVKALTEDLGKVSQKYKDLEGLHTTLKSTYETDKANHEKELKSFKMKTIIDGKHKEHLKFAASAKDIEKDGYFARLDKKYYTELNDAGDDIEVFDRTTKSRIQNPKKAGSYKSYADILEEEGMAAGIWATNENARRMNQNNSNFANGNQFNQNQNQQQNGGGGGGGVDPNRKVSSRTSTMRGGE